MLGGYIGKYLRVNLKNGEIKVNQNDQDMLKEYIGGTGIAARILFDEVSEEVEPLSERNLLIFATGPLTGTSAPGSGNYSVAARSPLSGFFVAGQANGHFGATLKKAGFDMIVFESRSPDPVYLLVENEKVTILDAKQIMGLGTLETEQVLKKKYGTEARVASIGPAGENMVHFAAIVCDEGHVVASGGLGAVMGSKNLKAVVVKGNKKIPIADKDNFLQAVKEWTKDAINSGLGKTLTTYGTAGLFASYHKTGWVPVKNLTTNKFPEFENFDGRNLRQSYEMKKNRCHACPLDHCKQMTITSGLYKGFKAEEPEYEDLAAWGPNIGNNNVEEAVVLTALADNLGIDSKESTFTISLVMECYEKGFVKKDQLDGLEVKWGDVEVVKKLLYKIATRDGIGKVLADGVLRTAKWVGEDALPLAVYVKRGYAPHVHDLRTRWGTLFTQAISNMCSQEGIDLTTRSSPDLGIQEPVGFSETGIAAAQAKSGPKRQFEDSLGVCYFLCRGDSGLEVMIRALNSLTGWDFTVEEALHIGLRIINLQRCFNIRHGHTVEDDSVSARILQPPIDGPGTGKTIADIYETIKRNYYNNMGWQPSTGRPLPETLERLGLGFAIRDLR